MAAVMSLCKQAGQSTIICRKDTAVGCRCAEHATAAVAAAVRAHHTALSLVGMLPAHYPVERPAPKGLQASTHQARRLLVYLLSARSFL